MILQEIPRILYFEFCGDQIDTFATRIKWVAFLRNSISAIIMLTELSPYTMRLQIFASVDDLSRPHFEKPVFTLTAGPCLTGVRDKSSMLRFFQDDIAAEINTPCGLDLTQDFAPVIAALITRAHALAAQCMRRRGLEREVFSISIRLSLPTT